jgi:hypothetical protein
MAKEFNLENYQYEEDHILFSEWLGAYQLRENHLNPNAKFNGLLFEHQGEEWDYIRWQPVQHQWTLVRDEDGRLIIRNGLAVKGRLGYFLGKVQHNAHRTIIVDYVPEPDPDLDF